MQPVSPTAYHMKQQISAGVGLFFFKKKGGGKIMYYFQMLIVMFFVHPILHMVVYTQAVTVIK